MSLRNRFSFALLSFKFGFSLVLFIFSWSSCSRAANQCNQLKANNYFIYNIFRLSGSISIYYEIKYYRFHSSRFFCSSAITHPPHLPPISLCFARTQLHKTSRTLSVQIAKYGKAILWYPKRVQCAIYRDFNSNHNKRRGNIFEPTSNEMYHLFCEVHI